VAAPVVVSTSQEVATTPTASGPLPEWPERPAQVVPGVGQRIAPWLTCIWAVGVLLLGLRDMAGVVVVRRLRRTAGPVEAEIMGMVESLREKIGVTRRVVVRWSDEIDSAVAIGWFSPAILLPMSLATGVPPAALQAILAHELAHIERHDVWVNLFQRFAETLLFFHPVVWWLSAEMRKERELCCDDIAVAHCGDRVQYVHGLLAMAEAGHPAAALAVSARGGDLTERVARILHPAVQADATIRPLAGVGALSLLLTPLALAFLALSAQAAEESVASTLQFPLDSTVGTVSVRWIEQDYRQQSWIPDHNEGWTLLAEAQGAVPIPEGCYVRLQTHKTDLSFLEALDPDALFSLSCNGAGLVDAQLGPIVHLSGLRALDLGRNRDLTDAGLDQLGGLKKLEWLGIEQTGIACRDTQALEGYKKLMYLDAFTTPFCDEGLRQASTLPNLQWLGVERGSGITSAGPKHLRGKKSLLGLNIENCKLDDRVLANLGDMPNLQYLALKNNAITDQGLQNLGAYPALESLNLSRTAVTDAWLCELTDLTSLRTLNLEQTAVTAVCKESLLDIPNLSSVVLTLNALSEGDQRDINAAVMSRAMEDLPMQSSSNPEAPKVGVFMSHFSATGESMLDKPYGYFHQFSRETVRMLDEANYDIYAVIEPGTALLGELPSMLQEMELQGKTIDSANADALSTLNVIVAMESTSVHESTLAAFSTAVKRGTGLVIKSGLGVMAPGSSTPSVMELTGLDGGSYTWGGGEMRSCKVVHEHPILGGIKQGTEVMLEQLSGLRGRSGSIANGTSLIAPPDAYSSGFSAMYVRDHGNGRIVCMHWFALVHPGLPFGQYGIYLRSINWAAKRDVESVW